MQINHHIIIFVMASSLMAGCVTVEIPVGDAIDSTKDWINEEREHRN